MFVAAVAIAVGWLCVYIEKLSILLLQLLFKKIIKSNKMNGKT